MTDTRTSIVPLTPALDALRSGSAAVASSGQEPLSFTVDAGADGTAAAHRSHSSHTSHASHASHHSHFSSR